MKLNHHEVITFLIQLSVILAFGRGMAELAKKFKQPSVVGEILAGIIIGPTVFGNLFPEVFQMFLPDVGPNAIALDAFIKVAVILLLFIAGLEVELHVVLQQGKQAVITSIFALAIPFGIGFVCTYLLPDFFGSPGVDQQLIFALFIGTTLSITALPVIARILMDLNVFKTAMGMLVIAAAMLNDLFGWLIFTVILSMMGTESGGLSLSQTIGFTIGFAAFMLTIGRILINKVLPWANKRLSWPGGILALSLALCFLSATFTEWIGIHSIFGAFIFGVALGDSEHLTERAQEILHQFINNIFAPMFFISIGLYINFITSFNLLLVLAITVIAIVGKISGASLGAILSGVPKKQAIAVGCAMNTHGTLEVILGAIALEAGLITEEVFVAILVMVVTTIIISGPLMKRSLKEADQQIPAK